MPVALGGAGLGALVQAGADLGAGLGFYELLAHRRTASRTRSMTSPLLSASERWSHLLVDPLGHLKVHHPRGRQLCDRVFPVPRGPDLVDCFHRNYQNQRMSLPDVIEATKSAVAADPKNAQVLRGIDR